MKVKYDEYYKTENLFGDPYPELLKYFASCPKGLKVLDLGCGQGCNAVALARMGFDVTGIDYSEVGIELMMHIAQVEKFKLKLKGIVADIYKHDDYSNYDFVLLDSMFHFNKKDRTKETALLQRIISQMRNGSLLVICIQDSSNKVQVLNDTIDSEKSLVRVADEGFKYVYEDTESGHQSESDYQMVVVKV